MLDTLTESSLEFAGGVLWPGFLALLVLLGFWLGARLLQQPLERLAAGDGERAQVFHLLSGALFWGLLVAGMLTALGTVGVDVSALVAGLGLTGLTIGFALKDVASSLMAGVLLMIYRPFRRGDRIAVAGLEGVVTALDMRYTHLRAEDGKRYLVPNATVLTSPVTLLVTTAPSP